ncbi:MAG: molybdopterin-binding protein [Lachnospiraceae bacterium]|nr:molybdopterin-binding protein [Lachnospiraceae bacterium]
MKLIKTEDAVGTVLCHDITQIIKGVTKDAVFRKGHIIREEDIPVLLSCGKESVYVLELGNSESRQEGYEAEYGRGMMHENEAADFLCDMCQGQNLRRGKVKEGKLEIFAECDGLLKVDEQGVLAVNSAGEMMIASRHGNFPVKAGDKVAGTRIIPLVIEEEKLLRVRRKIAKLQGRGDDSESQIHPLYNVLPFKHKKAAIIATGNEVKKGLIEDTFTPVIEQKLSEYDTEVVYRVTPGDEHELITAEILKAINEYDADIVLCTGGMSVDPDDRTPLAIRNTGARIVCYGAPVLPGAMFMLGYAGIRSESGKSKMIPIVGLPGCVMFHGRTVFDLILPRIMADDEVFSEEIAALGTGGLCLNCEKCTFPNCGFGK